MRGRIFRGLAAITAALLCISIVAVTVEAARESILNSRLGTVTNKIVDSSGTYATYFTSEFDTVEALMAEKAALAEEISAEGTVLLKNANGALPLNTASEKVTLWGLNSHTPTLGGMIGSTPAASAASGQKLYGIEEAMTEKGFSLNADMLSFYAGDAAAAYLRRGFGGGGDTGHGLIPSFTATYEQPSVYMVGEAPASIYPDSVLSSADGTAAVVVISRDSSEAADYEVQMFNMTEGDSFERPLALSNYERDMIAMAKAHSTKVIVLINADNAMEIEELKTDPGIDAIVWAGEPGTYGFLGVCDVLSGAANPSGHLPDTFAVHSASAPAMRNFGLYEYNDNVHQAFTDSVLTEADKAEWFVVENEGIYVGYKYYETRYEDTVLGGRGNASAEAGSRGGAWRYENEVSYPFGFGLSYTTFAQTLGSVSVDVGGTGTAGVTVVNTGSVAGKSAVQLYVQTPYTPGGVEKAAVQLIGVGKTGVLEPGATETVTIEFDPAYFASYDKTAVKADGTTGAWTLDAGTYYFAVGNGAHEALNNILSVKAAAEGSEVNTAALVSITPQEALNTASVQTWTLGARDIETYSANVRNELTDADINTYLPGTVEYTTRNDWTKGWTTISALDITEDMLPGLKNQRYALTVNSGDGVTWGADGDLKIIDAKDISGYDDPILDSLMDQVTLDEAIHFIAYAADDLERIDSILLPVTYMNDGPLGFAYDQVAGYATRWTASDSADPNFVDAKSSAATAAMPVFPTEPIVAATMNPALMAREGELMAEDGLWANESVIIGPGVNLHRTPYCARNHEYYSEDSVLTGLCAQALCAGAEARGLVTEVKHFAFNHQETNRSGISTYFDEQAGRENELRCFQIPMSTNSTSSVMTAFNRVGTDFAGGKRATLVNIARDEWGYEGAYVTDMINGADYMNWRDTVMGGGGVCLTATAYANANIGLMEDSRKAIAQDEAFQREMRDGVKRWVYVLARSNAVNGISPTTEIVEVIPWWRGLTFGLFGGLAFLTLLFAILSLVTGRNSTEPAGFGAGAYVSLLAAFGAGAAIYFYRSVMLTVGAPNLCLVMAIVLGVVGLFFREEGSGWLSVLQACVLSLSFGLSLNVMLDPIGYVVSGLYQFDDIRSYIVYGAIVGVTLVVSIFASFLSHKRA